MLNTGLDPPTTTEGSEIVETKQAEGLLQDHWGITRRGCENDQESIVRFSLNLFLRLSNSQQPQSRQIRTPRQGRFRSEDGAAQRSVRSTLQPRASRAVRQRRRPDGSYGAAGR